MAKSHFGGGWGGLRAFLPYLYIFIYTISNRKIAIILPILPQNIICAESPEKKEGPF